MAMTRLCSAKQATAPLEMAFCKMGII